MTWRGDYPEDFATVTIPFTTHSSTGAPVAPSSAFETADFKIYKNGNQAEKTSTNGLTIQSPHDSITGGHTLIIDTSNDTGDGGFWVAGAVYDVWLVPDETVDAVAVAKVVGTFGIELYGALRPTTTGRKLDVSAGGEAGVDWANVGGATTTVNLSGTTVKTATDVETDTQDIQSRLPSALTGAGNMKADAVALSGDSTAADNAESFFDGTGYAGTNNVIPTVTTVTNAVTAGTVNDKTGYALTTDERTAIANEVEAQIIDDTDSEKVLQAIIDKIASANPDLSGLTLGAIASAVWANGTRVLTAGTNIALAKGTGITGFNDLAAVDVRTAIGLASADLDTQLNALPTAAEIRAEMDANSTDLDAIGLLATAIDAKTTNLPATPAATGDIPTAVQNADTLLNRNVAGGSNTGRRVKEALAVLRNKVDVPNGVVYDTDDTTPLWTFVPTTAAGNPLTVIDPD